MLPSEEPWWCLYVNSMLHVTIGIEVSSVPVFFYPTPEPNKPGLLRRNAVRVCGKVKAFVALSLIF